MSIKKTEALKAIIDTQTASIEHLARQFSELAERVMESDDNDDDLDDEVETPAPRAATETARTGAADNNMEAVARDYVAQARRAINLAIGTVDQRRQLQDLVNTTQAELDGRRISRATLNNWAEAARVFLASGLGTQADQDAVRALQRRTEEATR
jgi:hypothetical protein